MVRSRKIGQSILLVLVLTVLAGGAIAQQVQERPAYVEGELLVKFKAEATDVAISNLLGRSGIAIIRRFDFVDLYHLRLPTRLAVPDAIAALEREALVEYAEPNGRYYLDATFPNDTRFGELWGLQNTGQTGGTADADTDAPEAWDITTGSDSVVVAVIDSGMELTHPDLAANLWTHPGETAGNGLDDDGNGYVDDVHGWDFSDDDNDPSPAGGFCLGHGTHTAGTIGAVGNNGTGVTGVNWNVQLMPIKAFEPILLIFCSANDADLIASIEYHMLMGVPVSSNSWGGGGFNNAMRDAIRASHSLFVAAAGNAGSNNDTNPSYPASYPLENIVSVAATTHTDSRAGFSNYGQTSVDLGAPGENILSTLPGGYGIFDGTSMATPHVAGAAALLLAQDATLTTRELKWRILTGADPTGLPVLTGGRLNLFESLSLGLAPQAVTIDVTPLGPTDLPPGSSFDYRASIVNTTAGPLTVNVQISARLENGKEGKLIGPVQVNLAAGQMLTQDFSQNLPPTFSGAFELLGQARTTTSFDEDLVLYRVD